MKYTKLFDLLLTSSVWVSTASEVKILWITILAMKDMDGRVFTSVPGLAKMAELSLEQTQKALKIFLSPDPHSRSQKNEGRRLKEIPGGWEVLNHEDYQRMMATEDRKRYWADKQAEYRDRQKGKSK